KYDKNCRRGRFMLPLPECRDASHKTTCTEPLTRGPAAAFIKSVLSNAPAQAGDWGRHRTCNGLKQCAVGRCRQGTWEGLKAAFHSHAAGEVSSKSFDIDDAQRKAASALAAAATFLQLRQHLVERKAARFLPGRILDVGLQMLAHDVLRR